MNLQLVPREEHSEKHPEQLEASLFAAGEGQGREYG